MCGWMGVWRLKSTCLSFAHLFYAIHFILGLFFFFFSFRFWILPMAPGTWTCESNECHNKIVTYRSRARNTSDIRLYTVTKSCGDCNSSTTTTNSATIITIISANVSDIGGDSGLIVNPIAKCCFKVSIDFHIRLRSVCHFSSLTQSNPITAIIKYAQCTTRVRVCA